MRAGAGRSRVYTVLRAAAALVAAGWSGIAASAVVDESGVAVRLREGERPRTAIATIALDDTWPGRVSATPTCACVHVDPAVLAASVEAGLRPRFEVTIDYEAATASSPGLVLETGSTPPRRVLLQFPPR